MLWAGFQAKDTAPPGLLLKAKQIKGGPLKKGKLREMVLLRKKAHIILLKKKSSIYEAFLKMEEATYADGELSGKIKELIAIGISVVINYESCMQRDIEQAAEKWASEKEILEVLKVGIEMGGGPATGPCKVCA
jgi:alkylhydroperoxidase/carboxymuconolactone decarboxylase family protein YurZ